MAKHKSRRQVTVEAKPMYRVEVQQEVNGTVGIVHMHEAKRISVSMSREQGDRVVKLTLSGAPPDEQGWQLTDACYTDAVSYKRWERSS